MPTLGILRFNGNEAGAGFALVDIELRPKVVAGKLEGREADLLRVVDDEHCFGKTCKDERVIGIGGLNGDDLAGRRR